MKKITTIFVLLIFLSLSETGFSQDGGNPDIMGLADIKTDEKKDAASVEEKKKFLINGFIRTNFATTKRDKKLNDNFENLFMGVVLQLQFEGYAGDIAHFYAAANIEYNNYDESNPNTDNDTIDVQAKPYLKLIEGYIDLYPANWFSLRAGHQLITWGEIDGIMAPTDILCPWDYTIKTTSFEEYKIGVTAIAANFFITKKHKLELVWIPIFQPSKLPSDDIQNKAEASSGGLGADVEVLRPEHKIGNGEYAGRISGGFGNNFRYGLAFLYGYNDLPDTKLIGGAPFEVDLYYSRVMVSTIDLSYDIKDALALKASAAFNLADDFTGKDDTKRNSTVEYLAGIESSNIGAGFFLSFYAGQMWVINKVKGDVFTREAIAGFDQDYRYKWLVSSVIQRNFLANDVLELSLRWALSMNPGLTEIDYTVNFNTTWKITSGVSATLGFVLADKIDVVQNSILGELKYAF